MSISSPVSLAQPVRVPLAFGSRRNPVAPHAFPVHWGETLTIREAQRKDARQIAGLIVNQELAEQRRENPKGRAMMEYGPQVIEQEVASVTEKIHDPTGQSTLLVAETRQGKIVGVAHLEPMAYLAGRMDVPQVGRVTECYVATQYQGKKLGRHLLEVLEKTARKEGFTDIVLEAMNRAKGFYKKMGYGFWNAVTPAQQQYQAKVQNLGFCTVNQTLMQKNLDPTRPWMERINRS